MTGTYTLPASVTSIAADAFWNNSASKFVSNASGFPTDSAGILFNRGKTTLYAAPGGYSGSYTIPSTVTTIYENAFNGCDKLTSVAIPKSVTNINSQAFAYCSALKTVYFHGDAPSIHYSAFKGTTTTARYLSGNTTWTSAKCANYGGTLTWTASSYLDFCTKYPTYLTLESTKNILETEYAKTLPCSSATNSGSESVWIQTLGEQYTATAVYKNTAGNYWYYCTNASGKAGYVYGGNVKVIGLKQNDISCNVSLSSTSPAKGKSNNITGSVSSAKLKLASVKGTLKDALNKSQTVTITSGFGDIKNSTLNKNLKFGSLSRGPGSLTILATANYYSTADGTSLTTHSVTKTQTINFTVMETYSVVYNANGGTNAPTSQSKTVGTNLILTTAEPTYTGYTFLGWSTSNTATTATYKPGATLSTDVYSGNLTLYAVWQKNSIANACGDNATWNLDAESGTLTISGTGVMYDYTSTEYAPWYANRSKINTVSISSGITYIGDYAFYYHENAVFDIPASVNAVGDYAFQGCYSLGQVPATVKTIWNYATIDYTCRICY